MSAAVLLAVVLAVVAVLLAGTAIAVAMRARGTAEAGARGAEALVRERTAALATLIDRRVATLAAQVASGLPGEPAADAAPTPPGSPPGPLAQPGPSPDQMFAYVEARLAQVTGDLEALVADLLRRHARSIRQDALAAAAQAAADATPRR